MEYQYLDRDISAINFNRRVLHQANTDIPLQEKLFLIGVIFSNLDEFLMSRYPRKIKDKYATSIIPRIKEDVIETYDDTVSDFRDINKKMKLITSYSDILNEKARKRLTEYFKRNILPIIQPKRVQGGISPKSSELNIFVQTTHKKSGDTIYHNISIPSIDRFIDIPEIESFVLIEELIQANLKDIFNGFEVVGSVPYKISRSFNMDMVDGKDIEEVISKSLKNLNKAWITQLEVKDFNLNKKLIKVLKSELGVTENTILVESSMICLGCLKDYPIKYLSENDNARKLKKYNPLSTNSNIFDLIKDSDILVTHPFESFDSTVLRFIDEAASDPDVIAIKMTLYRVSKNSKIVQHLLNAVDRGKSVTVMVELKARFNERDNLNFASIMKESGIDIIYSDEITKTHAKMCLVTRQEGDKIRIYSHVGTGNYSETNSRVYTDYSYFTRSNAIGRELNGFFNIITGSSENFKSNEILFAPSNLRSSFYELIQEQIDLAKKEKPARIIMKCNAFTDEKMAKRLYDASNAGVKIILLVRGACIIIPGIEGMSSNIKIFSVVGRFLEHSRVYLFGKGDNEKLFIGSADMMERNLTQRNELLIQIKESEIKDQIKTHLKCYLKDTTNLFKVKNSHQFNKVSRKHEFNAHEHLIKLAKKRSV